MAVTIELVSDVSDVIKGAGKVAERFADVSDSLVDLARDSQRSGDKIETAMKDAGRSAEHIDDGLAGAGQAADAFEDKARAAFKAMSDGASKAGDKAAHETKQGFDKSGEAVETFKDEAKSNLSEVTSSFSGDMDSAVDLIQGTLGGLVADLGPADLPPEVTRRLEHLSKRIYRILMLSGYARLDYRLTADGRFYLLEANPNPNIARDDYFSDSAKKSGLDYEFLLQKLMTLGMSYDATTF
jgi:cytochrome c551/c552